MVIDIQKECMYHKREEVNTTFKILLQSILRTKGGAWPVNY